MGDLFVKPLLRCSAVLLLSAPVFGATLFIDTFNRASLADPNWAVLGSGHIVIDPLSQGHGGVLAFNSLAAGGDVLSLNFAVPSATLYLSFDFLSTRTSGPTGGYIGVDNPGENWLTGDPLGGAPMQGMAVGKWLHGDVSFAGNGASQLNIKLEQFSGGGGSPNDMFFDNIVLSDTGFTTIDSVPEPSAVTLFALGIAGIVSRRFRRQS
jgi:hypothetical protein